MDINKPVQDLIDEDVANLIISFIDDYIDFPTQGVVFKDLSPLLENQSYLNIVMKNIIKHLDGIKVDKVVAIEARGFVYGAVLANKLGVPLILARKHGKLPGSTISENYEKEYGMDELEMQLGSIHKGDNVVVIDDVLATGNTAKAVEFMIDKMDGKVKKFVFILELAKLSGRKNLGSSKVLSCCKI